MSYRGNHFNLIRLLATVSVLYSHAFALSRDSGRSEPLRALFGMSLGTLAVSVFFVVSGYLAKNATLVFGFADGLPGDFEGLPLPRAVNGSLWTLPLGIRLHFTLALMLAVLRLCVGDRSDQWLRILLAVVALSLFARLCLQGLAASPEARLATLFFGGALMQAWQPQVRLSTLHRVAGPAAGPARGVLSTSSRHGQRRNSRTPVMTRIFSFLLLAAGLLGCQALPSDTSADAEPRCRREDVTGSNISRCSTGAPTTDEERRAAREAVEGMREDQMRRHLPRPPGPPGQPGASK